MKSSSIFIFSGEQSADIHGSLLAKALLHKYPLTKIFGVGGEKLREAGVTLIRDNNDLGIVGFIEALKHYNKFKNLLHFVSSYIIDNKIDLVILIDFPGFNLRLAKYLKSKNVKIAYYISPQIWAWGRKRIQTIKDSVEKIIVIFNFEEKIYKKENIPVSFVGHPLVDSLNIDLETLELDKFLNDFNSEDILIALLPGSRKKEVEIHLPIFLAFAKLMTQKNKKVKFVISSATNQRYNEILKINNEFSKNNNIEPVPIFEGDVNQVIKKSDFVILVSGTVSLQAAYYQKPLVVVYKVNFFSYLIIKMLIKTQFISLVNIVAEEKIVPELIQNECTPQNIEKYINEWINNKNLKHEIENKLKIIRERLGEKGASERVAEIIGEMINA